MEPRAFSSCLNSADIPQALELAPVRVHQTMVPAVAGPDHRRAAIDRQPYFGGHPLGQSPAVEAVAHGNSCEYGRRSRDGWLRRPAEKVEARGIEPRSRDASVEASTCVAG